MQERRGRRPHDRDPGPYGHRDVLASPERAGQQPPRRARLRRADGALQLPQLRDAGARQDRPYHPWWLEQAAAHQLPAAGRVHRRRRGDPRAGELGRPGGDGRRLRRPHRSAPGGDGRARGHGQAAARVGRGPDEEGPLGRDGGRQREGERLCGARGSPALSSRSRARQLRATPRSRPTASILCVYVCVCVCCVSVCGWACVRASFAWDSPSIDGEQAQSALGCLGSRLRAALFVRVSSSGSASGCAREACADGVWG
mmetsp:Transcript_141924/g.344726  ORF Transcript_141924/g.344726 Transcript_141924/m.344726 type:complete len:257 (+) Transcript_141924:1344-2114(+)